MPGWNVKALQKYADSARHSAGFGQITEARYDNPAGIGGTLLAAGVAGIAAYILAPIVHGIVAKEVSPQTPVPHLPASSPVQLSPQVQQSTLTNVLDGLLPIVGGYFVGNAVSSGHKIAAVAGAVFVPAMLSKTLPSSVTSKLPTQG